MKKNSIKILFFCLSIIWGICLFIYSNEVILSVRNAIIIWGQNIIPSLYPFFILSEILIYFDAFKLLGNIMNPIMKHIFHLSPNCAYIFLMSMFSGCPGGSKYTTDLLSQKQITKEEANYLITITHFCNPLFIIGTIGSLLLQNNEVAFFILIAHFSSNFILAFFTRPKTIPIQIQKTEFINEKRDFMTMLANAILKTFQTLIIILGIIIIFFTLSTILEKLIPNSQILNGIISGILEMTSGIHKVNMLPFSIKEKAVLITAFLSFGGFSIHMQVATFLTKCQLSYKKFLISRIYQTIISVLIILILIH